MLIQKFSEANENNLAIQSSMAFINVDFTNVGTTIQVGNEIVKTITDAEMLNLLEKSGVKIPKEARAIFLQKAGTTKIVWTGAKRKGNVKIYLSKTMLCTIQGLKVAAAIVGFITGLIGKNYAVVSLSAMKAIAYTIKVGSIKHGRIYTIKGWKYKGATNQ